MDAIRRRSIYLDRLAVTIVVAGDGTHADRADDDLWCNEFTPALGAYRRETRAVRFRRRHIVLSVERCVSDVLLRGALAR